MRVRNWVVVAGLASLAMGGCENQKEQPDHRSEANTPKQSESSQSGGTDDSTCPVTAGESSIGYGIAITDGELREPRPEEHPDEVKKRIGSLLESLRNDDTGLSCRTEHNLETHFQVADAFYADGRLERAWLTLHNLEKMLQALEAVRRGDPKDKSLVRSQQDIPSYRALHNVHVITSNYLTGAQPSRRGYKWLKEHGVTDVVTLRTATEHEKQMIEELGLNFHQVGWPDKKAPDEEYVDEVLSIMDQADGKVFQHCLRGIGRDMTMSSLVQIQRGEDVDKVIERGKKISPTWAADQEQTENGKPVQFEFIREYARENL